ncbi:hypothetical protein ACFLU1_04280 [Chloroflexota bacterium]
MVKEINKNGSTLYICEECGMAYPEKAWAEKCQAWCSLHHACNLEIMEHAVPLETD